MGEIDGAFVGGTVGANEEIILTQSTLPANVLVFLPSQVTLHLP